MIPFLINIIRADGLDIPVKKSAAETFNSVIECRPKLIGKKQLVFPCLESFVTIIAKSTSSAAGSLFHVGNDRPVVSNADEDDEKDEDFDENDEYQRIAQMCIDKMALKIPSKYFVQPALNICSQVSSYYHHFFRLLIVCLFLLVYC